jgi:hypothetical protein
VCNLGLGERFCVNKGLGWGLVRCNAYWRGGLLRYKG